MQQAIFHNTGEIVMEAQFEQRVKLARKKVFSLAYRMLDNKHDAEDIVQETFVRAWINYAAYDPARSFEAWVSRIAANLCFDAKRRSKRRQLQSYDALADFGIETDSLCKELADSSNDPAERLQAQAVSRELLDGLQSLPASHRHCLWLLLQQHTYLEIAAVLGCPLGTVRSRIHRARAILREVLVTQEGQVVFA